jgi:hypothetical protein
MVLGRGSGFDRWLALSNALFFRCQVAGSAAFCDLLAFACRDGAPSLIHTFWISKIQQYRPSASLVSCLSLASMPAPLGHVGRVLERHQLNQSFSLSFSLVP